MVRCIDALPGGVSSVSACSGVERAAVAVAVAVAVAATANATHRRDSSAIPSWTPAGGPASRGSQIPCCVTACALACIETVLRNLLLRTRFHIPKCAWKTFTHQRAY